MRETEVKILEINVRNIKQKMRKLGAKKILDDLLRVHWYRPKRKLRPAFYLRIREFTDGSGEVTWKGRSRFSKMSRSQREIHFQVSRPGQAAELFGCLDLQEYAYQEKHRTSWKFGDFRFDLDQYPGMPAYLEIEGKSDKHIREGIKLLGLEESKVYVKGERELIQKLYGLDWYCMKFKPG